MLKKYSCPSCKVGVSLFFIVLGLLFNLSLNRCDKCGKHLFPFVNYRYYHFLPFFLVFSFVYLTFEVNYFSIFLLILSICGIFIYLGEIRIKSIDGNILTKKNRRHIFIEYFITLVPLFVLGFLEDRKMIDDEMFFPLFFLCLSISIVILRKINNKNY